MSLSRPSPGQFVNNLDEPLARVFLALPALLAAGRLRNRRKWFELPAGFHPLKTIFLVLAFSARGLALRCRSADPQPALVAETLTARLHLLPSRLQDAALRPLAAEFNAAETVFPGTNLRLIFALNGLTRFRRSGGLRLRVFSR